MAKSGSKLIVGLISFLLGFIFALLAEIGAIVGVYFYVTSQDIDSLLDIVGLPNKDADGNNKYVNTDPDNGGAKTIKDLIARLKDLFYDDGQLSILNKSFNDFESLIPATSLILDMVYDAVGDFITIDSEKFESVPLTDVAQVIADSLLNVHVGSLLDKIGSNVTDTNIIIRSLLLGAETEYASVVNSDVKLPVLYDIYTYDGIGWSREKRPVYYPEGTTGTNGFHGNLTANGRTQDEFIEVTTVNDTQDGELIYRTGKLCYVPCRVTNEGILPAKYEMRSISYTAKSNEEFVFQYIDYADDTDFITVQANKDGSYVLDYDAIMSAVNHAATGASDRFVGYSYFEDYGRIYYYIEDDGVNRPDLKTISGKNYFRDKDNNLVQLDPLTLSDLIYNAFGPLYSISITEVVGDNGSIAGEIFGKTTLGDLLDGNVNLDNLINDLQLSTIISDVKPDDSLMAYIVYKLTDVKKVGDAYTAIYDKNGANQKEVTVTVDENGYIVAAYYGDVKLDGVKVTEVADIVNNLTGVLTIGDIIDVEGNSILEALKDSTIDGIGENIKKVKLGDIIEAGDNKLLQALADSTIDGIADRVDSLTVVDLLDIEDIQSSAILSQLRNVRIVDLSEEINELSVQRIYAKDIYGVEDNADPTLADEFNAKYLYYSKGEDGVYRLAGEDGHVTAEQFAEGEYYTYGEITSGMWKLILCDDDGVEQAYSIEDFNSLVSNSTGKIYGASIRELYEAGIITGIDESKLDGTIGDSKAIGEWSLQELISYVLNMVS